MMESPLSQWSFLYTCNGSRYSFEIAAHTEEEAKARAKALAHATYEGRISPAVSASAESAEPSA